MSLFRCLICDETIDNDWIEAEEYKDGHACVECIEENER